MTDLQQTASVNPAFRTVGGAVRRPLRAWFVPAFAATGLLAVLGLLIRGGPMEGDLAARIKSRLDQAGQAWAVATVSGRSVAISGVAPSVEDQQAVADAVRDVWGVAMVNDRSDLIPLVQPFVWSAFKAPDKGLVVSGYVPSAAVRGEIRDIAATIPGVVVADNSELARGAPAGFAAAAAFATRLMADVAVGSASISDAQVTVSGTAIDALRYEAAQHILNDAAPAGFTIAKAEILPPLADPFVWSVRFDGQTALISGNVPSLALGESIAAAAGTALGGVPTDDRTQLASGAPDKFEATARLGVSLLGRLAEGSLELSGPDLSISGRARSVDDYDALREILAAPAQDGLPAPIGEIAPALVKPFVWQATRSGTSVELAGFMPSEQAREEVVAEAGRIFGSDNVQDRIRVADGAPKMDWIGATKFALTQLAALSGGAVNIIDRTYSLTGTAATAPGFEELTDRLQRTLPASLEPGDIALTPPFASPYRLAVAAGADGLTIEGTVPSVAVRQAVHDAAADHFGDKIAETTSLASGAPDGFEEAVTAGVQAMSRLASARFELIDRTLTLSGEAAYPFAADRIEQQLAAALPPSFVVKASLTVRPPQSPVTAAECQDLVKTMLETTGIRFAKNDVVAAPESEGLLDLLVATLQRCPQAKIEIGAYTDSGGSSRRNAELSQHRAAAVLNYLSEAGVQKDRLSAVGYGEANPVASNDTDEGRAKNRRIEFKFAEQ